MKIIMMMKMMKTIIAMMKNQFQRISLNQELVKRQQFQLHHLSHQKLRLNKKLKKLRKKLRKKIQVGWLIIVLKKTVQNGVKVKMAFGIIAR